MMAAELDTTQRITRLTPLADVRARIDALVRPVAPRAAAVAAAFGRVLADDLVPAAGQPDVARALRDGFAVSSDAVADAGPYAPAPLRSAPARLDVGDALPPGADAVAPLDAIVSRDGRYQAVAPVTPGEGVLAAAADLNAGSPLRGAGERLRAVDIAVATAAGINQVTVRAPRVLVVTARLDPVLDAAATLVARAIAADGGEVRLGGSDLTAALGDADADAIIAVGGTGSGRNDASVRTLAHVGRVEVHGIALAPGETAAFGVAGPRPVLLLPGRLDAALAVWLVIGRRLLARLSASTEPEPTTTAVLERKIASSLGMTEVVPVRCRDRHAEPIASGYLPLQALASADGWVLVPPDSEGYPAGAEVVVRPWP